MGGCRECGNETSGSIKGREHLDQLSNHRYLKKNPASWGHLLSYVSNRLWSPPSLLCNGYQGVFP